MSRNLRFILGILGAVILLFGLWYFRNILSYVVIAAILSFIGAPLGRLFGKIKIKGKPLPGTIRAILVLMSFVFVVALFLNIFAPLVASEARALSSIDTEQLTNQFTNQFNDILGSIENINLSGDERSNEKFFIDQIQEIVSFGDIQLVFNNIFGMIGNAFIALFSILFIAFFFLQDPEMVRRIITIITPDKHGEKMKSILQNTRKLLTRYFGGLMVQVTIVTVLISLGLTILGVENAFLIGFLAGLVNLIPYLGPIIGAIIGIIITFTTNLHLDFMTELLPLILKIAGVFLTVQLIDNFVIQPYIFSNSVNAHPLEIFIVISMAGTLAGVGGMIVAIPAYTLIRIVAKEFLSGFKVVRSLTDGLEES